MNDLRDTCQGDRAADRAASAARTLAAIANDAARKYVKRNAVTAQANWAHPDAMTTRLLAAVNTPIQVHNVGLDAAEVERQARLRRWHAPAHPNRKGEGIR